MKLAGLPACFTMSGKMAKVQMTIVPLVHLASLKRGFLDDLAVKSTLFVFIGLIECCLDTAIPGLGIVLIGMGMGVGGGGTKEHVQKQT